MLTEFSGWGVPKCFLSESIVETFLKHQISSGKTVTSFAGKLFDQVVTSLKNLIFTRFRRIFIQYCLFFHYINSFYYSELPSGLRLPIFNHNNQENRSICNNFGYPIIDYQTRIPNILYKSLFSLFLLFECLLFNDFL